ncbi:glutamine synthetase family protein [Brevibacterium casei]|uniref:glutamine synthetase family protein n=1 Tax=Brevibacterium casei TaxID=33889 RepID=UPI00223B9105|nr:glutamine synthetase family protein [Brevibacterium casei]MCT1764678.1 glutamine synthetase family protein [Brevibacterium casei]
MTHLTTPSEATPAEAAAPADVAPAAASAPTTAHAPQRTTRGSLQAKPLTLDELRRLTEAGEIDTVVVAVTDAQGRLQGKRLGAQFFLDDVAGHGSEACNYLLAVDVDMNTVDGYEMSSWETGYGDMVMQPDLATLRLIPWQPGTAMVNCDLLWTTGAEVTASPRQILKKQLDRLAEAGMSAHVGTELEFITFDTSYEDAFASKYQGMTPANQYNVDYSLLGTARIEPLLRDIRNSMAGAGLYVEGAKGECNFGQHEITFRYQQALKACDDHAVYKNGAKEIAAQHGKSITFMAKYDQKEGSSCHIHLSFRSADGDMVMAGDGEHGFSPLMEHFIAGQLACIEDFTYFFAPNINSYKRFVEGSFAPTAVAWGFDNRTCAFRVVGSGPSLRVECRVGGADLNPYLAAAALIAAGLHGIENELELPPITEGNAYTTDAKRLPTTLTGARDLLENSEIAKAAFGDDVVRHYVHAADVELDAYNATVTDWERIRGFERL